MSTKFRLHLVKIASFSLACCSSFYTTVYSKSYNSTFILIISVLYCIYAFLFTDSLKVLRFQRDPWQRERINLAAAICAFLLCITLYLIDYTASGIELLLLILAVVAIMYFFDLKLEDTFSWLVFYYASYMLIFTIPLLILVKTITKDGELYFVSVLLYTQCTEIYKDKYKQVNID